jgi:hypothetical protein
MNDILNKAIETYGEHSQIDKAIEEMAELTKALLKLRYCEKDFERQIVQDAVSEEMADVEIMLTQLHMIFGNTKKVEEYQIKKIKRLERRLS